MKKVISGLTSLALVFFFGCVDSLGADAKYDNTRYEQMRQVIDSSTNKLIGISLQDASRLLSLENVKWDEGYTSVPFGQSRIYHFKGFYLLLNLRMFPRRITPESQGQFSVNDSGLRTNGVWWVANFDPALQIDGIDDPKVRMSNYWEQARAGFGKRTEEMNKQKALTNSAAGLPGLEWIAFASGHKARDLLLLEKKLQAGQIHCMDGESERYMDSFLVESNDFARAKVVAAKIISENSLTVNIEADIIGLGQEIWQKGKRVTTIYF